VGMKTCFNPLLFMITPTDTSDECRICGSLVRCSGHAEREMIDDASRRIPHFNERYALGLVSSGSL
jgi:hypothetical protein